MTTFTATDPTTGPGLRDDGAAAVRRSRLVARLTAAGHLPDPAWRATFAAVPRDPFAPQRIATGRAEVDGSRAGQRPAWLDVVYSDTPLAVPAGSRLVPCPRPSRLADLLTLLDVETGMTVLEVGTGSGYSAALLAHRLGDQQVTTIDETTIAARRRLAAAGYLPTVVTAAPVHGHLDGAPYDRILSARPLTDVPPGWPGQLTPDGVILAPLAGVLTHIHRDGRHQALTDRPGATAPTTPAGA